MPFFFPTAQSHKAPFHYIFRNKTNFYLSGWKPYPSQDTGNVYQLCPNLGDVHKVDKDSKDHPWGYLEENLSSVKLKW